jgi:phage N-6-adenine-methyltransferase
MSLAGFKSSNHPQQVAKRGATERDNLGTDPALYQLLTRRFFFTLDVAASAHNAKCSAYYTSADDGLAQRWYKRVWCNPPYSQIRPWVEKAWAEWRAGNVQLIVMLLPANRTEQAWWQDLVEPYRDLYGDDFTVEFIRGRQRFVMPGVESIGPNERPPFGCCLLIWARGVSGSADHNNT